MFLSDFCPSHLKEADHHGVDLVRVNRPTAISVKHVEHPVQLVLGRAEVGRADQVLVLSVQAPEAGGVDRQHVLLEIHVPAVVFVKHS